MASMKDAIEESMIDKISILKYGILGGLIFYCLYLYSSNPKDLTGFWIVSSLVFLFLFGFLIKCTSNVRNGQDHVLPSFNVFHLFWAGIKGTVALGPLLAISFWLCKLTIDKTSEFMAGFGVTGPGPDITINVLFLSIFGAIVATGYMLYSKDFKISDAYNFITISKYSMDIMIKMLFFVPQLLIVDLIVVGAITYLFWIFIGVPNNYCTYFWCMAIVWNLAIIGNYIAQMDYETIEVSINKY